MSLVDLFMKHHRRAPGGNVQDEVAGWAASRIVELEQERDELKSMLGDQTLAHSQCIERERALEAHVERLHKALDNVLHEVGTHSHDDLSDDEKAALEALADTPTISLASRDPNRLQVRGRPETLGKLRLVKTNGVSVK